MEMIREIIREECGEEWVDAVSQREFDCDLVRSVEEIFLSDIDDSDWEFMEQVFQCETGSVGMIK